MLNKKLVTLVVLLAILSLALPVMAYANSVTYRGQGLVEDGYGGYFVVSEVCDVENGAEQDGYYLLWVFTATKSDNADITGPWGTADMIKTANGTFKYVSEYYPDLGALIGEVVATYDGTDRNPQLVISHGCTPSLDITKTAETSFTREYDWTIEKSVDPDKLDLFNGQSGSVDYTVDVTKSDPMDYDFVVSGQIVIENNTSYAATITGVSDVIESFAVEVDCGVDFPYDLAVDASLTCTYETDPQATNVFGNLNTATVTTTAPVRGGTATAPVIFGEPTLVLDNTASVSDSVQGFLGEISASQTFKYSRTFTCAGDAGEHGNTATVTEVDTKESDSDDANVTVNCYAPTVRKNAFTEYTRQYSWNITKDYDNTYNVYVGESVNHNYQVAVTRHVQEYGFRVYGTITVENPHPSAALTVSVADSVGGVAATLDCGSSLLVPAGSSATCGYSAGLSAKTDGTNTATVSAFEIDYPASAGYAFGNPTSVVGYESINVTDTNGTSWTASGSTSWTYSREFSCEAVGSYTHVNTATIFETDQNDNATVVVNCTERPVCYAGETAWAEGPGYIGATQWAMYVEYTGPKTVNLIAGQHYDVGDVTFSDAGEGMVNITITLQNGAQLQSVSEPIKIQGYDEAPTGNPNPGGFAYKGGSLSVTVPYSLYYGVHVDVARVVDCP